MKVKTVIEDNNSKSNTLKDLNSDEKQNQVISFEQKNSNKIFDPKANRFECMSCGFIYDPDEGIKKLNIEPGTAFLDIDREKFRCPVCRVGFGGYKDIGPKSSLVDLKKTLLMALDLINFLQARKTFLFLEAWL